jgi:hypothetical protein
MLSDMDQQVAAGTPPRAYQPAGAGRTWTAKRPCAVHGRMAHHHLAHMVRVLCLVHVAPILSHLDHFPTLALEAG